MRGLFSGLFTARLMGILTIVLLAAVLLGGAPWLNPNLYLFRSPYCGAPADAKRLDRWESRVGTGLHRVAELRILK